MIAGVQQVKQSAVQRYNQSIAHVQYPDADQLEISRLQALQTWKPSKKRVVDRNRIPDFQQKRKVTGTVGVLVVFYKHCSFHICFCPVQVTQ